MQAKRSLLASLANGIVKDQAAVLSAITMPEPSGQVEGQFTKLKMIKQQMYGFTKLDLLEAHLIRGLWIRCTKSASEPIVHADPQGEAPYDNLTRAEPLRLV